MFLTTMRVRRARTNTLDDHAVSDRGGTLVEVTCHGAPIAVLRINDEGDAPTRTIQQVLWIAAEYKHVQPHVMQVAEQAVAVMAIADTRVAA